MLLCTRIASLAVIGSFSCLCAPGDFGATIGLLAAAVIVTFADNANIFAHDIADNRRNGHHSSRRPMCSLRGATAIAVAVATVTTATVGTPPPLSPSVSDTVRTACRSIIPGLTRDQIDLCQRASDVTAVAIVGLDMAVAECQHQFRWHRWNCSSLGNGGRQRNPHYSSTFLHRGKRFDVRRAIASVCVFIRACVILNNLITLLCAALH